MSTKIAFPACVCKGVRVVQKVGTTDLTCLNKDIWPIASGESEVTTGQETLKGESVVAAILLSRMEVSYCTLGFFVAKPAKPFH